MSSKSGCGIRATLCLPRVETAKLHDRQGMTHGITQAIETDHLDLAGLLEKLAAAGLCFSDLFPRGQTFRLRVAGSSMLPALHTGDQITVEAATLAQLQVGDLLLFHHRGSLICHRLVALERTGAGPQLTTKGDATTGCDAPLHPDQVLGRVVEVRPSWLPRLRDHVAQGLLGLQGLRSYRRVMRALLSRCLAYYVGVPQGRRWFHYQRIGGCGDLGVLVNHHWFHLVARFAGICVGSLHVEAGAEGFWLRTLYVRIPCRGLGVGSHLLNSAVTATSRSKHPVLLASVEPTNTAALQLLTKAGFRNTGGLLGNQVSLRRDL